MKNTVEYSREYRNKNRDKVRKYAREYQEKRNKEEQMNKEIEEAVLTAEDCIGSFEYYEKDKPEYVKAIKLLQDLAKRYLEIKGFPEEKEQSDVSSNPHICFENAGYNQALQDFKLALLKKMDGIEDLLIKIMKKELINLGDDFCFICGEPISEEKRTLLINYISEAIKSHLMKG